ncbi:MAG: hypothetical protein RL385_2103 [Pseudomonadota bacterium]|jgi:NAD(P)-dependent dehydrogenase (short-subunit alcohol dehydrogenase family)
MGAITIERRTVLLTGGRAPVTLELARLFAAAGHRVVLAESLALPLTAASRAVSRRYRVVAPRTSPRAFVFALRDIVRRECVDLVVPTCEEVFHLAQAADLLRVHTRVFVSDFAALRTLHSKQSFIDSVLLAKLPAPHTQRVTSRAKLVQLVAAAPGQLVLKPEFSRFATETRVGPRGPDELGDLDVSPLRPWVVQARVHGKPVCAYAVAHAGRLTAYAAYAVVYTAGLASTIHFEPHPDARVEAWVRTFVAAREFTGQIAFDFIVQEDGVVMPLECNPRATSGVHLFGDQPALARAFFDPAAPLLHPSPQHARMLAVPMLVYGLPQALKRGRVAAFLHDFIGSRDVVWRLADPGPALLQGAVIFELIALALRHRTGLLAASTLDIEYNGEQPCVSS